MKVALVAPGSSPKWPGTMNLKKLQEIAQLDLDFDLQLFGQVDGQDPFFSDSDENRASALVEALNSTCDVVWCLRGGYGTARVLDKLAGRPNKFKWVVGYSDITALQFFLHHKWGWKSLHGPVFESFFESGAKPKSELKIGDISLAATFLRSYIRGEVPNRVVWPKHRLTPLNDPAKKSDSLKGQILGGNLSVIQTLLGTEFMPSLRERVLFLEDSGERGYRIHRMLSHLQATKVLHNLEGLVFGDFSGGLEANGKSWIDEALLRFANELEIPVWKGLPVGHGDHNSPIVQGAEVLIANNIFEQVL